MRHTVVEGGSGGETDRVDFTGALSVHDGKVRLVFCEFRNGAAEDGINLKYCGVDLRRNLFAGSKSDAVDLDFCSGRFVGNKIADAGGDGLDLSGSKMIIAENSIVRCGDKGLSVGERTCCAILGQTVADSLTGIAVKDSSSAMIEGGRFSGLRAGISLYVKKPTFGPSHAKVRNVKMYDVGTRFLRESSCLLQE